MPIRNQFVLGGITLLASIAFASPSTAACVGSTCSLGGQLRAQAGDGLPIPISMAPAPNGDLRWGQPGQVVATPMATIMQESPAPLGPPSTDPRSLMLPPGAFAYDGGPVSKGVIRSNPNVFAVRTNLAIVHPHPGTTTMGGAAIGSVFGSNTFGAGPRYRTGAYIASWCVGLPAPTASFNPGCAAPDSFGFSSYSCYGSCVNTPTTNGLVRYLATKNQFGGSVQTRVAGTVQIFFNEGGLALGDLPCVWGATLDTAVSPKVNPDCVVGLATKEIANTAVPVRFGAKRSSPAQSNPTGVFTAHIGANGTILGYKTGPLQTITTGGTAMLPKAVAGQATTSWGLPFTTGRMTISVTQNAGAPTQQEIFSRTGGDQRTAGGQGIVVMVAGAVSARSISGPNGDRRWLTLNVPEPSALGAGAAGFLALLGCHAIARRRRPTTSS
jgi:hypothetical protein